MKKFILAALLALPLTMVGVHKASAGTCCSPTYKVGFSVGLCFKGWCGCDCNTSCDPCKPKCGHGAYPCGGGHCGSCCGGGPAGCGYGPVSAGPWYTYYPYGAHFQTPAPTGYPYWPSPAVSGPSPMFGQYSAPQAAPMAYPGAQVTPCGYYQQAAPSYWYNQQ